MFIYTKLVDQFKNQSTMVTLDNGFSIIKNITVDKVALYITYHGYVHVAVDLILRCYLFWFL